MYDLRDYRPQEKWYGEVRKGWHEGRIYAAELRNGRSKRGKEYQYINMDIEITDEGGVLVPAFFFHNKAQEKPEPLLGKLISICGVTGDYRNDQAGFFMALIGTELRVKVVHKFKKKGNSRVRMDQVVGFEPLSQGYDSYCFDDIHRELTEETEDGLSENNTDTRGDDIPF